jgi:hypothetical protein
MKITVLSNVIPCSLVDVNHTAFILHGVPYLKILRRICDLIYKLYIHFYIFFDSLIT